MTAQFAEVKGGSFVRQPNHFTGRITADCAISSGAPSRRSSRFSASRRRVSRSARPSSTWVRRVASSRLLSHGFSMKSRAPRRMASTAFSTLPQAVITTVGRVASRACSWETSSRPSRPVVVSRA